MIQGTFISELLDLRLRKVTVELLTGQILRSLVAPSKEGPADSILVIPYLPFVRTCGGTGCEVAVQSKVQQLPS